MSVGLEFWTIRTVIAVLGKGLSEASFTTVFLYTTELYPTVIRLDSTMSLFELLSTLVFENASVISISRP